MDSKAPVVIVRELFKTFKLPHEQHSGIKQAALNIFNREKGYETQKVLSDISFEVNKGDFFGIVGRNGSGKSTLLKLLAGIYVPDQGLVHINGSLTPFIELGVGFNPELTGRENVFMNGALLGFDHTQMESMYDDIVEFAELKNFMDQKLKNYSSGMQVRLAFSIAIKAESDILLIDEVLAVGDARFQEKCLRVFERLKKTKKTIIFISHDMSMVERFCDRAVMIENSRIVKEGTSKEIAALYRVANLPPEHDLKQINEKISLRKNKIVEKITLVDHEGDSKDIFKRGDKVRLKINLKAGNVAKNMGIAIYTIDGSYVFGTNTIVDEFSIENEITYEVSADIGKGQYFFKIGVFGDNDSEVYEFFDNGPAFYVVDETSDWGGIVHLSHRWIAN